MGKRTDHQKEFLETGSWINFYTPEAARGKSITYLIIDEAAFIPFHWQNHSYAARKGFKVMPIINTQNFPYFGDLVVK